MINGLPAIPPLPAPDLSGFVKTTDQTLQFVSALPMSVANLLANFPAGAAYVGKYARVTDLWGGVDEVMRCSYDGTSYYWRPQRTDYAVTSTMTSGAMTWTPLVSAPEICFQITLLGILNVTLGTTNAYPGMPAKFRAPASLGVGSLILNGLIGGATSAILGGSDKTAVYTSAGWRV